MMKKNQKVGRLNVRSAATSCRTLAVTALGVAPTGADAGGGDGRASGRQDMVDYFKTNIGFRIMKYWEEDHNEDLADYL